MSDAGKGATVDPRNPFGHPLNPHYGAGVYRRKIRLVNTPGRVEGALEDCNHGFCVVLEHDGQRITRVLPEHRRIPMNTCGGAAEPLRALVGIPLGLDDRSLARRVNTSAHCTHWLDLTLLAIAHADRTEREREYLVNVPDYSGEAVPAEVWRNGELIHRWMVADWAIHAPAELVGKPLYKGFTRWAAACFGDADQREAAQVLQKGYFVSSARMFDASLLQGDPARAHTVMHGSCYTYSEPRLSRAVRLGASSVRDFSDTPEALLRFE